MRVGIAYDAFTHSFKHYFPKLEVIKNYNHVKEYDLIIFSGGEDINPSIYGSRNLYSRGINLDRDEIERSILIRALDHNKKILGVCRGHQLINAVRGGRLLQDIYIQGKVFHEGYHPLQIEYKNSIVGSCFTEVNSLHHQGVSNSGSGLKVTSYYKGIIESTESKNIISVQFHPEFMVDEQSDLFFEKICKWVKNDKEFSETLKEEPVKRTINFESYLNSPRTTTASAFTTLWNTPIDLHEDLIQEDTEDYFEEEENIDEEFDE